VWIRTGLDFVPAGQFGLEGQHLPGLEQALGEQGIHHRAVPRPQHGLGLALGRLVLETGDEARIHQSLGHGQGEQHLTAISGQGGRAAVGSLGKQVIHQDFLGSKARPYQRREDRSTLPAGTQALDLSIRTQAFFSQRLQLSASSFFGLFSVDADRQATNP
jgi:hypothetical protein